MIKKLEVVISKTLKGEEIRQAVFEKLTELRAGVTRLVTEPKSFADLWAHWKRIPCDYAGSADELVYFRSVDETFPKDERPIVRVFTLKGKDVTESVVVAGSAEMEATGETRSFRWHAAENLAIRKFRQQRKTGLSFLKNVNLRAGETLTFIKNAVDAHGETKTRSHKWTVVKATGKRGNPLGLSVEMADSAGIRKALGDILLEVSEPKAKPSKDMTAEELAKSARMQWHFTGEPKGPECDAPAVMFRDPGALPDNTIRKIAHPILGADLVTERTLTEDEILAPYPSFMPGASMPPYFAAVTDYDGEYSAETGYRLIDPNAEDHDGITEAQSGEELQIEEETVIKGMAA